MKKPILMEKERLGAFIDAVIAIIMTILVLELEKPAELTLAGLWDLKTSFFAYALSFFWLASLWANLHVTSQQTEKISQQTVWAAMVMLFFSSFSPYTTKLIALDFNNATMQAFYGLVVLAITFSVQWYYKTIYAINSSVFSDFQKTRYLWMSSNILGLVLTLTIYPPAVSMVVLITLCAMVIPSQLKR